MNRRIVIGIGSNLNRRRHIQNALDALSRLFGELKVSTVYRTKSVGFNGPDFFNLVCIFYTDLSIGDLQKILKRIEQAEGRDGNNARFSSRTLDLDVLLYGNEDLRQQGFNIPRDEILKYAYVLEPLAELLPEDEHPGEQRTFRQILEQWVSNCDQKPVPANWSPAV